MRTTLDKEIVRPFDIAPVQYYTDNKNLITVQNMLESGTAFVEAPHGFIVGAHGDVPIYLNVEAHLTTMGKSGSEKTVTATSNLLSHAGSAISLEISGATFKKTYNYRKHVLKQKIYLFDPHNVIGLGSSNYNPLDDLDPTEEGFYSRVITMASSLISDADGQKEQNPYFRENPHGLITALILYLKLADPSLISDKQKNFRYLAEIFSKFPSDEWRQHIGALKEWRGRYKILLNQLGNYLSSAQDGDQNARSIVSSTAQWLIKWTADDALINHMVSSDFSMQDLRDKKATVYIVMPTVNEYITYQPWLRLILQSAIDCAPNKGDYGKGFKQEDRILIMIDELTQLGHLQVVATGAQTVRQKGIVFWSIFQDYASLRAVYGEDRASAFLGASDVVQIFRDHEDKTVDYVSKHLGRYMVHVPVATEGQVVQSSVGHQESVAKGTTKQTMWQLAKSKAISEMVQKTVSKVTTIANNKSNTYSDRGYHWSDTPSDEVSPDYSNPSHISYTEGSSVAVSDGNADTEGRSTQAGETESKGGSDASNETKTTGLVNSESVSGSRSVTMQPIIIDGMDCRDIANRLSGNKQILLVDSKEGSYCTSDDQARYYKIPFLKDRADGPPEPEAPAFPDPPEKTVVRLTPVRPINLENFKLDENKLNWKPEDLVRWTPPTELSEWGQGVKETRAAYDAAQYRLDVLDETAGFFQKFFRNPFVQVTTAVGVVSSCFIGKSVAAAGITFGALMLTGIVAASWQRHKLERVKMDRWKDYRDMRGAAMTAVRNQLVPVMAAQDTNEKLMNDTVQRQNELVAGQEKMETVLTDRHECLTDRIEEHRINLENCHQAFQDIRSGAASGWSSGDWENYVQKLRHYYGIREKFFDFDKEDYLPAPTLVTPSELGALPPRTLFSKTAPIPVQIEAEPLAPKISQEVAVVPTQGAETRGQLQAYFDKELVGYDLPDDIKTVGDAVTRRAKLAGSDRRRAQRAVMQMDAALEDTADPCLVKFDGLVRGYVSGLRLDEDAYTTLLRQQIREGQRNAMETIEKIRQFNGQVLRLNEAQSSFDGFAQRLDEVRARAHHRAHMQAIREMEGLERSFERQSEILAERGPLVPPKQPKKRQELPDAQPSK